MPRRRTPRCSLRLRVVVAETLGLLLWASNTCMGSAFSTSTSSTISAKHTDITLDILQTIHDAEIVRGTEIFGSPSTTTTTSTSTKDTQSHNTREEEDFMTHFLGSGNAGTDASLLQNGDCVFQSRHAIVTKEECQAIIEEARATIAQGLLEEETENSSNNNNNNIKGPAMDARARTNSQLGEAALSNMPPGRLQWLQERLQTKFLPLLQDRFGLSNLVLYDGLVLGAHAPSRSQPIHRDASLLTLNIALSSLQDYDGGGTYVEALDNTLKIDQGHLLCHTGGAMHAGVGITRGERWVLVLFVLAQEQPQMPRRCHAQALEYLREEEEEQQQFDQAEQMLQTGLEIAPKDHLLHNTMGRLRMEQNRKKEAMFHFQQADAAYPICNKAMVSMAQLLLEQRRPRAALRRFETVLQRIQDRDLHPNAMMSLKSLAWAARRDAAKCALLCSEHVTRQGQPADQQWICQHLPTAIQRIETCLVPAPQEPNLQGMLRRANDLLEIAKEETCDNTSSCE